MSADSKVLVVDPAQLSPYTLPGHGDAAFRLLLGRPQSQYVEILLAEYGAAGKSESGVYSCDHVIYVLEGRLAIAGAAERHEANSGQLAYIPAGVRYRISAQGEPTRFLLTSALAGATGGGEQILLVDPEHVEVYVPPGHDDTYNRLLLGPEQGCRGVEIILGKFGVKGAAHPHAHPYEQIVYMLEGINKNISNGVVAITHPGQLKFIPGDLEHQSEGLTETKFLLLYAPPRSSR